MSTFREQLRRFSDKVERRTEQLFDRVVEGCRVSIVEGSAITGAPGQPTDEGDLKDSWDVRDEGPLRSVISSDSPYARAVEENWGGVTYRNHGPHSVELTRVGFPRLVEHELRQLRAAEV